MEQLFQKFDAIKPLSPALKNYIISLLKRKAYKKGQILVKEGEINKYIYFIEKGLVRSVRYKNGNPRTGWFMKEGDFCLSVRSFFTQEPSPDTIETMEPTVVYYLTFEELQKAYRDFPEFNLHGRIILQYYYQLSEKRNDMREQRAFDKFTFLMDHQPELIGRVKDKDLASYLGMAPETFSLQKKKFARKKTTQSKKRL